MNENIISSEKLQCALKNALKVVDKYIDKLGTAYPGRFNPNRKKNTITPGENCTWATGFWPGVLWLAFEASEDEKYKEHVEKMLRSFKIRIENELYLGHHDLGFLYSLSCVAAYKLTGNEEAKESAIKAADYLIRRYTPKGEYILAWMNVNDTNPDGYFYIIDCLMNIPLLYWATDVTGDGKYRDIAQKHLKTTMNTIIRPDGTTSHKFLFDGETGAPREGRTGQGFSNDSCWSRGQAWGVYGFAISYGATKDPQALESFKRVTGYFIDNLPEDNVPFWDFVFKDGDDEPRDSSAAAIAVCGILEILKFLPENDPDREYYVNAASKMLNSLIDNYSADGSDGLDGLIRHYTGSKPHGNYDSVSMMADYFYLEALVRCLKDWNSYWY